jgi:hypothetical protein
MGVLDFFFGRTKPTPTTTTTVQSSKLPEEIAPYVTQVLEEAKAQYDIAKERGYQPYPGETIAKRTPGEEAAIAGLRGLIGTQQPYQEEAEAALRGIGTEFTADQAEKFMSPYQQAVVDVEKRKAEEDFRRRVMPEFEKQAVGAGGMSGLGSRAGVQAALLGSEFSQQLGDIQTKGQQKAYEDAYRQFVDQGQRQRAQAEDLRGMGLQKFQTGLAEQGLGQQLAQADRQEAQSVLDKAFKEYTEQEQYPESELAQLSSFVYGNPFLQTPDRTTTKSGMLQPTSSIGQGLLGLGLTGLNIYGQGGGFKPGGSFSGQQFLNKTFGYKTGGRIVHRQEGGEVPNIYNNPQASPAERRGGPQLGLGLGSLFGRIVPRRQTNVIENIDNAAGSLNDYKEAMDQDMLNLSKASSSISRTYNQTFGNPLRFLMGQRGTPIRASQSPGYELKADTFGMKAGGGLGSLPVVKRKSGTLGGHPYMQDRYPSSEGTMDETDAVPQKEPTNNVDRMKQILDALKAQQGTSGYGVPTDDLLSGELAKRQADRRKKTREEIIKGMKEAMPKSQRLSGLLVAAKRVMGADPSKGFINAVVEGMAGLDEAQQEDYLRQKEQELKILELEGKGKLDDLTATEAAETQAAKFPIKIAEIEAKKIGNKFKLSKIQIEATKAIMSNLDQIAADPSSYEKIVEATLSAIPGNERIVFGADLLAAIKTKAFEIIGRQGGSTGVAYKKRGASKGQSLIDSRENILKKLPNINRPEGSK